MSRSLSYNVADYNCGIASLLGKLVTWLIPLPLILLLPFVTFSQTDEYSILEGKVVIRATGEPLQNVNIILMGTAYGGTTDEEGIFRLGRIPQGRHTIVFSHVGFAIYRLTQEFEEGEIYYQDVEMFERPIRFDEMEVVGEKEHPVTRTAPDSYLITRRDIIESGLRNFSDLLRSYVPRISVQQDGFDLIISLTRETSLVQRYRGHQNPLIILNGVNIGTSPTNLNGIIKPEEIQRVEVIRGPSAIMYGPEGEQGVILVDTIQQHRLEGSVMRTMIFGAIVLSYFLYAIIFW